MGKEPNNLSTKLGQTEPQTVTNSAQSSEISQIIETTKNQLSPVERTCRVLRASIESLSEEFKDSQIPESKLKQHLLDTIATKFKQIRRYSTSHYNGFAKLEEGIYEIKLHELSFMIEVNSAGEISRISWKS
jgi:hypothetical protein